MSERQRLPEGLADMPPGPSLAVALAPIDRSRLSSEDLCVFTAARYRLLGYVQAELLADMFETALTAHEPEGSMTRAADVKDRAAEQVAWELGMSSFYAEAQMQLGRQLVRRLPAILDALRAGHIDYGKAAAFVECLYDVDDDDVARAIADQLLGKAAKLTVAHLRERLRYQVGRAQPDKKREKYLRRVCERDVWLQPYADGTAHLGGSSLPPHLAAAAFNYLDRLARAARADGDARVLSELRADAFLALLSGEPFRFRPPVDPLSKIADEQAAADGTVVDDPDDLAGRRPTPTPRHRMPRHRRLRTDDQPDTSNNPADRGGARKAQTGAGSSARRSNGSTTPPATPKPEPGPTPEPRPAPRPVPEPGPGPSPDPEPNPAPRPVPEPGPGPSPDPEPNPAPRPVPEPGPGPSPDPEPNPAPRPVPEPSPAPRPEPQPSAGPAAPPPPRQQPPPAEPGWAPQQWPEECWPTTEPDDLPPEDPDPDLGPPRSRPPIRPGASPGAGPRGHSGQSGVRGHPGTVVKPMPDYDAQATAAAETAVDDDESAPVGLAVFEAHDALHSPPARPANICSCGGIRPGERRGVVDLTVKLTTLARLDNDPGLIAGFEPVIADIARQVALAEHNAPSWQWSVTDETGLLLHHGHTQRRPTAAEAAFVIARDQLCATPGCRRPADRCDLDHRCEHEHHGPSHHGNLGPACGRHHPMRQRYGYKVALNVRGIHTWTAPNGRTYTVGPDDRLSLTADLDNPTYQQPALTDPALDQNQDRAVRQNRAQRQDQPHRQDQPRRHANREANQKDNPEQSTKGGVNYRYTGYTDATTNAFKALIRKYARPPW